MANNIFVAFDLYKAGQDYNKIETAIKALGSTVKLLNTTWFISTALSGEQVRDRLAPAIDQNDRLLVIDARQAWGQNYDSNKAPWHTLIQLWSSK